jgi:hypothetical protein
MHRRGEGHVAGGDSGVLLEEAIRIYGDPQLWARYQAAVDRRQGIPRQPAFIGSAGREWRDWNTTYAGLSQRTSQEVAVAERALHKEFKQRLQSGELIASGIKLPITAGSQPEPIAPPLWDVLVLDVASNRARSEHLTYRGVRILSVAEGSVSAQSGPVGIAAEVAPAPAPSPSFPGRPSLMNKVSLEMDRRASESLLCDTLKAESDELATWIAHEFPAEQTPTAKTIRKALRQQYNQLKARNTDPK